MAIMNMLSLYGSGTSDFPVEDRNTLGDLLVHLLYDDICKAASIIQKLGPEDQLILKIAGEKLGKLCEVYRHAD